MTFIKNYSYAFVLGGVLDIAGWSFMTWQFYAAIIPIILLVSWKAS